MNTFLEFHITGCPAVGSGYSSTNGVVDITVIAGSTAEALKKAENILGFRIYSKYRKIEIKECMLPEEGETHG